MPLSPPSPSPSIAMFSLTGDPYSDLHMLSPWLDHQLVWFSEKDSCLFLRAAIDKQHQTCSISFHSALSEYRMCNVYHSHPHTFNPHNLTSSYPHTSSHPHTFTFLYPHILTPSHLHILIPSHPHTLTPSHIHTCTCRAL